MKYKYKISQLETELQKKASQMEGLSVVDARLYTDGLLAGFQNFSYFF